MRKKNKLQKIIGAFPKLVDNDHILNVLLSAVNAIIHPPLCMVNEKIMIIYHHQGITEDDADCYKQAHGKENKDISNLYKLIITNPAYNGLVHPMITI